MSATLLGKQSGYPHRDAPHDEVLSDLEWWAMHFESIFDFKKANEMRVCYQLVMSGSIPGPVVNIGLIT